jgi:hypothetical protein
MRDMSHLSGQDRTFPLTITHRCAAESMVTVAISIVLDCTTLGREMRDRGLEHVGLYEDQPSTKSLL